MTFPRLILQIVPPKEWIPRRGGFSNEEIGSYFIPDPIQQRVDGREGAYTITNLTMDGMTVQEFRDQAESVSIAFQSYLTALYR